MPQLLHAMQAFFRALSECNTREAASQLLLRIFGSVLADPKDSKVRRLRKDSRLVKKVLPEEVIPHWIRLLEACGWRSYEEAGEIVLPEVACLFTLEFARSLVWDACKGAAASDSCGTDNLLLTLAMQWVHHDELAPAIMASHAWHCLEWSDRSSGDTVRLHTDARSIKMEVHGDGFHAACWPLETIGSNPLEEFNHRVQAGPVAGGDARVSRVDMRTSLGFSRLDFGRLLALPRQHGKVDARGRLQPVLSWREVDGGIRFWRKVLAACRVAEWQSAEGASWTWSERGSMDGRAHLLGCQKLMWVFSAPQESNVDQSVMTWAISCEATFSTAP
mmetsp:Transcript_58813/g.137353  ORF Transcript_58813/g.137353 Transcript_58813/m.137353 type:complete len:333 (-) Transcript_58813:73-1071(-)